ncbi:MAG: GNAT family N-acetyltransferase [Syntrophomonas sp.]
MRYALFEDGQETIVSKLVWTVFKKYEAPDYPPEGVQTFKDFIEPDRLKQMAEDGNSIYCCFDDEKLVGVLAFRGLSHISLLFVDEEYHRQGIAKTLLDKALKEIVARNSEIGEISVNSSPYAEGIYTRMGFTAQSSIQQQDGIRFIPMLKKLP